MEKSHEEKKYLLLGRGGAGDPVPSKICLNDKLLEIVNSFS
jgi:hypothetical protein